MSKARWINEEIRNKLAKEYIDSCDRRRRAPQTEEFREELEKRKKDDHFIKKFGKDFRVPSLSWFNKKENIRDWRRKWKKQKLEPLGEDKFWHLGTLDEYPHPADAIKTILQIHVETGCILTVREAKWIARLHEVIENKTVLRWFALVYAHDEQVYEILRIPFDSSELDTALPDYLVSNTLSLKLLGTFIRDLYLITIIKRQNELYGKSSACKMEEEFVGYSLGGQPPFDELSWRFYGLLIEQVMSMSEVGKDWENLCYLSYKGKEALLMHVRDKVLELKEAIENQDFNSFWTSFSEVFK